MGKAIALATPVFFLLIAIELLVARARGLRGAYRLNDAINSLSLGVMSQVVGLFVRVLTIGIYAWVFEHVALGSWPTTRGGHGSPRSCSTTSVTTGTTGSATRAQCSGRRTSCITRASATTCRPRCARRAAALLSWIFYVPMALAGVPPAMFAVAAIVDLLYQYWIHTELVGKLGWFDRWFASPSNHRVHHAVNDRYIDRNYGGIFMVWDRLFGTFVEEIGALRLRHARAAELLGPALGQRRGVCGPRAQVVARRTLARQGAGLVHAARLATGGASGGAVAETRVRPAAGPTYDPPMSRGSRVFATAAAHARDPRHGAAALVRRGCFARARARRRARGRRRAVARRARSCRGACDSAPRSRRGDRARRAGLGEAWPARRHALAGDPRRRGRAAGGRACAYGFPARAVVRSHAGEGAGRGRRRALAARSRWKATRPHTPRARSSSASWSARCTGATSRSKRRLSR